MNTHPMTPTPDSWHEMSEPMTYPALVQFDHAECLIIRDAFTAQAYVLRTAVRWRPWVNPELPKPLSAFEQWYASAPAGTGFVSCWKAAESYGRAAERSRFAEGVDAFINKYAIYGYTSRLIALIADLRALAKGTP